MFATRIDRGLIRDLKILSIAMDAPMNALMEEAIRDLFVKLKHVQGKQKKSDIISSQT